jgi:hypothetical protein
MTYPWQAHIVRVGSDKLMPRPHRFHCRHIHSRQQLSKSHFVQLSGKCIDGTLLHPPADGWCGPHGPEDPMPRAAVSFMEMTTAVPGPCVDRACLAVHCRSQLEDIHARCMPHKVTCASQPPTGPFHPESASHHSRCSVHGALAMRQAVRRARPPGVQGFERKRNVPVPTQAPA